MHCISCQHENPVSAKFCLECGGRLAMTCAKCSVPLPPGAKFCLECGAAVGAQGSSPSAHDRTVSPSSEAYRGAPSAPALPTFFASGRYQVQRFLGEGAKKRVYLAHDTKLDRDVAFALIKTDGLDADGLVRIHREAQAMGRLGDHPHIVTVYDTGDENGQPYIVSQYMPGGSVEDLLQRREQHRLPTDQALRVAAEVCRALQHAHGRGIIHRDLKSGNVWLSEDGTASLGDFGLAVALDRSRLTMAGMMVGTVAYMPPEQALGRAPDARSDLYALGAMLYEMVTGRPPFLGDDAVAVISQHINTAPVAPTWHNPDVPRGLEALILKLLAKAPNERPESAAAVAEELRRVRERTSVDVPVAPPVQETTDLRGLDWGLFVGRRAEMGQLKGALENALSGNGSLTMLVGEPGIGKTRLAEEFAVYAAMRGAQVLTGRCYEGEVSLPYRPFVEALRQYIRARPDPALRDEMGPGAPEIATLVSEIRQRFADIQEAPKLEAEAERLRLFDSVTQFVHNAATANPVVVFLDDLHWADKPSLLLLRYLARALGSTRVLMLGAYRDVDLDRAHPLAETLATLRREQPYQRVLLRGLPEDDVLALLNTVDPSEEGAAARKAFAAALYQETEGNPFFIREVLTHLVEEGKLFREAGRWRMRVASVSQLGIPEGVREVIGRRLSRLSEACNRMLTLASTMTGGFTWEALKAVSQGDETTLLDLLDEALRAQLVHERKGEQAGRYEFTHALIRQTLYEELSTPRRVLLHRQIGETLEKLYAANVEPHLAELAHHFYQAAPGGDVEKAIEYAKRAGDRAIALCAWEEAESHYERAVQAVDLMPRPDEARRCELLLALAAAKGSAGEFQGSMDSARQAGTIARRLGAAAMFARAAISFELARGASNLFDVSPAKTAARMLEEALALLGEEDSALRAEVVARLALAQYLVAPQEQRTALSRQAVEISRRVGDRPALAAILGIAQQAQWGPENVEARREAALDLLHVVSDTGDRDTAFLGRLMLLTTCLELGDLPAADREIEALAQLAEGLRSPRAQWTVMLARAMRLLLQGRFAEAESAMQHALAAGQRMQSEDPMNVFGGQLVDLRHLQGRLLEVEPLVKDYVDRYPHLRSYQCVLAEVYSESGRTDEARSEFERLAADDFADLPLDVNWLIGMYLLTEVCWFLGDARRAAQLYDLILPYAGRNIVVGNSVLCTGSASRQLGIMATVMERWDEAERHFTDALEMDTRMGARPWVVHDQFYFGDMLLRRNGPGDRQRALALVNEALNTAQELGMQKIIERALALKVKTQGLSSTDFKTSIDAVASVVQHERPDLRAHAAPDGTVTIMFSDMEGFTMMTERLGDLKAREVIGQHNRIVREQLAAHGGFEVELQGDGFLLAFPSARRGLLCAIAIQREMAAYSAAHPAQPIKVRIGLHTGEAIREADKFFGKTVILAARIAAQASGGEVLVSSLVKELTQSAGDIRFADGRETALKGLSGTYTLHPIRWIIE